MATASRTSTVLMTHRRGPEGYTDEYGDWQEGEAPTHLDEAGYRSTYTVPPATTVTAAI
jgi:hypothetical protein